MRKDLTDLLLLLLLLFLLLLLLNEDAAFGHQCRPTLARYIKCECVQVNFGSSATKKQKTCDGIRFLAQRPPADKSPILIHPKDISSENTPGIFSTPLHSTQLNSTQHNTTHTHSSVKAHIYSEAAPLQKKPVGFI